MYNMKLKLQKCNKYFIVQVALIIQGVLTMDFNAVVQAISTIGFPIVMCLILMYYVNKLIEAHKTEIDDLRKTIEANTLVTQKLVDTLNGKKDE